MGDQDAGMCYDATSLRLLKVVAAICLPAASPSLPTLHVAAAFCGLWPATGLPPCGRVCAWGNRSARAAEGRPPSHEPWGPGAPAKMTPCSCCSPTCCGGGTPPCPCGDAAAQARALAGTELSRSPLQRDTVRAPLKCWPGQKGRNSDSSEQQHRQLTNPVIREDQAAM